MREFFRGWKRKVGCVMLVLACVFAALWVRGEYYLESVQIIEPKTVYSVRSFCGRIWLVQAVNFNSFIMPRFTVGTYSVFLTNGQRSRTENMVTRGLEQHGVWRGSPMKIYSIPYWPIVTSLTVISAWLRLSKPRTKRQPPSTPASENA